jgi:hypothetical protein
VQLTLCRDGRRTGGAVDLVVKQTKAAAVAHDKVFTSTFLTVKTALHAVSCELIDGQVAPLLTALTSCRRMWGCVLRSARPPRSAPCPECNVRLLHTAYVQLCHHPVPAMLLHLARAVRMCQHLHGDKANARSYIATEQLGGSSWSGCALAGRPPLSAIKAGSSANMPLTADVKGMCKVAAVPVDAPSTAAMLNAELLAQRPPSVTQMLRRNI